MPRRKSGRGSGRTMFEMRDRQTSDVSSAGVSAGWLELVGGTMGIVSNGLRVGLVGAILV